MGDLLLAVALLDLGVYLAIGTFVLWVWYRRDPRVALAIPAIILLAWPFALIWAAWTWGLWSLMEVGWNMRARREHRLRSRASG